MQNAGTGDDRVRYIKRHPFPLIFANQLASLACNLPIHIKNSSMLEKVISPFLFALLHSKLNLQNREG
jgi:hypothetical protein